MAELKMERTVSPKLMFFEPEFVTDSVESSFIEMHYPVGFSVTNQSNPVRFFVRGSEMWIDLEKSYFYIEGTVTGRDNHHTPGVGGAAAVAAPRDPENSTQLSLTNNFVHNLFSSVHVKVNEASVTFNNDNYPYLSYIQRLFNQPRDYQDTAGNNYHFRKDTAGHMNVRGRNNQQNTGARNRDSWLLTRDKYKVQAIMKLHSPLLQVKKYLLSFLDLDITMNRVENPQFYFMSDNGSTFNFRLDSIVFFVRKAKLIADYVFGIERMLKERAEGIMYPLKDCRVFTKTYSGYGAEIIEDNLFHGVLPSRVIVGLVSNEAYKGAWEENPFNFQHFDLTEIGFTLNGVSHPLPMIPMNFASGDTHRIYHHMLDAIQGANPNPGQAAVALSKHEFDNGFTLFNFDMSSDLYGGLNHQSLFNKPANLRLQLRFRQGNATNLITLVVYYELNSRMFVNGSRQVSVFSK